MSTTLVGLLPLVSPRTRMLILGSFPGEASLKAQQYYGHARNQFWAILQAIYGRSPIDVRGSSYQIRSKWLLENQLGLWDVYASCQRVGSLDSHIRQAVPNDVACLLDACPQLQAIAFNGSESFRQAKHLKALALHMYRLPSSSPANAAWSFERKLAAWRTVLQPYTLMTN
ncbi:MAG: DNA-deoxyinosine glycosylase [Polaromonas sp.]|jgi:hypoxanthine-DNA glycosylase|nr:DNA-deoxyinosine glycosylase [Polaromonas sp.]